MLKSASSLVRSFIRPQTFRLCSSSSTTQGSPSVSSDDEPVILENNPYTKEPRKCLLCSTGVELDYKNSRLLQVRNVLNWSSVKSNSFFQQFVSTFSGRVYDRHITGLCDEQQKKLIEAIAVWWTGIELDKRYSLFRNRVVPGSCQSS